MPKKLECKAEGEEIIAEGGMMLRRKSYKYYLYDLQKEQPESSQGFSCF